MKTVQHFHTFILCLSAYLSYICDIFCLNSMLSVHFTAGKVLLALQVIILFICDSSGGYFLAYVMRFLFISYQKMRRNVDEYFTQHKMTFKVKEQLRNCKILKMNKLESDDFYFKNKIVKPESVTNIDSHSFCS